MEAVGVAATVGQPVELRLRAAATDCPSAAHFEPHRRAVGHLLESRGNAQPESCQRGTVTVQPPFQCHISLEIHILHTHHRVRSGAAGDRSAPRALQHHTDRRVLPALSTPGMPSVGKPRLEQLPRPALHRRLVVHGLADLRQVRTPQRQRRRQEPFRAAERDGGERERVLLEHSAAPALRNAARPHATVAVAVLAERNKSVRSGRSALPLPSKAAELRRTAATSDGSASAVCASNESRERLMRSTATHTPVTRTGSGLSGTV